MSVETCNSKILLIHVQRSQLLLLKALYIQDVIFYDYHFNFMCSCWLSAEKGTIFGFVAPMLVIILVRRNLTSDSKNSVYSA